MRQLAPVEDSAAIYAVNDRRVSARLARSSPATTCSVMAARRVGALFYVGSGTPMTTTLRRKDAATWGGTNADYTDLLETGALRSVKFLF